MYKNQLQELAQRSCFNLPAYTSIREGPDHAPRFKAVVNFNGEAFESPSYCSTLRQAEHSAAEVALNALACRGPSNSLAARILDETGVYKNLLQEVSQRVGASLPAYSTFRSGLGHLPIFTCTVELAGVIFTGMPAKNKKQAEKNAAMAAWLSLKSLQQTELPYERSHKDEQEHVTVARALQKYLIKARLARTSFPIKFPTLNLRPLSTQPSPITTSKILPLICPKTAQRNRPNPALNNHPTFQMNVRPTSQPMVTVPNESQSSLADIFTPRPQKFPAAGAAPYIPVRHCNPHSRIAPPVTIRNMIPVFSAPPLPSPQSSLAMRPPPLHMAPPVSIRQAVPVFAAPVRVDEVSSMVHPSVKVEDPRIPRPITPQVEEPLFSTAVQGTLDDSPFSKLPPFLVEDPFGYTNPAPAAPISEAPTVQDDLATTKAPTVEVKPPVPSVEETTSAEQDKQLEPAEAEIKGLEDLKI
ncbi:double-stranded RNA-binding protein 2-like isoform X2 [Salvia splendens]|uniref:double-stranded RNA-binding protein 2-like isoform X2 n=1 Tax=Salvia splendens TaxID=180675 RepID=UPI0011034FEC|nr:double-stranded RNA-binding protein 2-like isoform X2 [Salvia splendens]